MSGLPLPPAVNAESAETPAPAGSSIVELVPERRVWSRLRRRKLLVSFAAYVVFFAAAITADLWARRQWPTIARNPLASLVIVIVVGSLARAGFLRAVWWLPKRRALNVGAAAALLGDPAQLVERLTACFSTRRWLHPETFVIAAMVTLSRRSGRPIVLVVRRPDDPGLPPPATDPFEPIPLDDSDAQFDEMAAHMIDERRRARRRRWPAVLRRIGRNIIIGDVPFYAFIMLLFLLLDAFLLIRFGRLTLGMGLNAFFFYLIVLRPRNTAFSGDAQWWAIPSALLIRGTSPLRFNAAAASLAILQCQFGRWFAAAVQEDVAAERHLTRDEVLLLLSAWTSSVRAPEFVDAA